MVAFAGSFNSTYIGKPAALESQHWQIPETLYLVCSLSPWRSLELSKIYYTIVRADAQVNIYLTIALVAILRLSKYILYCKWVRQSSLNFLTLSLRVQEPAE